MQNKKLLDNGNVEITTVREVPRYSGRKCYAEPYVAKDMLEDIRDNSNILFWTFECRTFEYLDNWDVDKDTLDGHSLEEARAILQEQIDNEKGVGTYHVFVLGVYEHGAVSFSISDNGDTRCRWDSRNSGFVAIPTDTNMPYNTTNTNKLAGMLSDIHNGDIYEMFVYDNLMDEVIEAATIFSHGDGFEEQEFTKEALEKYNVDFDKINFD